MSSFVIKIIAIISMLIDHSGDVLIGYSTPLNFIGRIAFPLFCFQLVIGYAHTRDVKNYCIRLGIFALISQIPFSIMLYSFSHQWYALNVFFTLLLGVFCMLVYDSNKMSKLYKILSILGILVIAHFANVDYQALGVLIILIIHIFYKQGLFHSKEITQSTSVNTVTSNTSNDINTKNSSSYSFTNTINTGAPNTTNISTSNSINNKVPWYLPLTFIIVMIIFSILRYLPSIKYFPFHYIFCFILFTFIPTFIMLLYNGKKGPSLKYFFYVFYPAHIILLNILHWIFIG